MVRFGVPNPAAVWAMTAGVPLRRVAIALGASYRSQIGSEDRDSFLAWLATVDYETLQTEYRLTGALLDDVNAALARTTRNPLLTEAASLEELLPLETEVRGTGLQSRAAAAAALALDDDVELLRDYDNTIDRNAVLVNRGYEEIGYLPRHLAQLLAPEMDAGASLTGTVIALAADHGRPRVTIRVNLRT